MRTFIVIACILGTTLGAAIDEWQQFKSQFKKNYANGHEEQHRMKVFFNNKKLIEEHNIKYKQGLVTYTMAINHLGDLEAYEMRAIYNGFKKRGIPTNGEQYVKPAGVEVPDSMDWRQKGAVTPVKDQGQCGSCWAFSAVGALEGQQFMKTGVLVPLSEQDLVECCSPSGTIGCNGGLFSVDMAFQCVKDKGGIDTEKSYPYTPTVEKCHFNLENVGATATGYVDLPTGDEDALKSAVATVGPISVTIDAGQMSFQFYSGGIYNEPSCSSYNLDHGVLAVGYGSDNGQDYWLVKNSWGNVWGDQGYIKMTRNKSNQCGIATQASYPLL